MLQPAQEDDFFGVLDAKPAVRTVATTKRSTGKLVVPASKKKGIAATSSKAAPPAPAVKKLAMDNNDGGVDDGWDDF